MTQSFANFHLNKTILKNLAACRYETPTAIQTKAIPIILEGKDVIASAPTGTGKTAAFVLPLLNHLSQHPHHKPRVLVLTPTRELATQITDAIHQYGRNLNLKTISIIGGTSYQRQFRDLAKPVDIIVATPGRLIDQMQRKKVDLSGIEVLVLDEADRMLDMGFIEPVRQIAKLTPKDRQTLLFSATVNQEITKLASSILKNPERISIATQKTPHAHIEQKLYMVKSPAQKLRLLQDLLAETNMFKVIIFSATKIGADRLANDLSAAGYSAAALHGDMRQSQRTRTIDSLRRGKIQLLVATDVGSRGLDIEDLTHVINYHLPRSAEDYVHRIGRTGRAGKMGVAISFASPEDGRLLKRIEHYTGKSIPKISHSTIATNDDINRQKKMHEPKVTVSHRPSDRKDFHKRERDHFENKNKKKFKRKESFRGDFHAKNKDNEYRRKRFQDEDSAPKRKKFYDKSPRGEDLSERRYGDKPKRFAKFNERDREDFSTRRDQHKRPQSKRFGARDEFQDNDWRKRKSKSSSQKFSSHDRYRDKRDERFNDRKKKYK